MKDYEDILSNGDFTKRKTRVNGKAKGNRYENSVAKILNETFETTDFCRSPGSGAFATTHALPEHIKVYGDLITPQNFRFVIECKNGYKVNLDDVLNRKSKLWEFIEQAKRDGKKAGKDWMLIYKKDRRKAIAITNVNVPGIDKAKLPGNCFLYQFDELIKLSKDIFFV